MHFSFFKYWPLVQYRFTQHLKSSLPWQWPRISWEPHWVLLTSIPENTEKKIWGGLSALIHLHASVPTGSLSKGRLVTTNLSFQTCAQCVAMGACQGKKRVGIVGSYYCRTYELGFKNDATHKSHWRQYAGCTNVWILQGKDPDCIWKDMHDLLCLHPSPPYLEPPSPHFLGGWGLWGVRSTPVRPSPLAPTSQ